MTIIILCVYLTASTTGGTTTLSCGTEAKSKPTCIPGKCAWFTYSKTVFIHSTKTTLKASLKNFNIPTESWEQAAQDRTKWCYLIRKGAAQYELMKQRESVKLKESAKNAKQEPRDHHQSPYSPSSLAIFATDS